MQVEAGIGGGILVFLLPPPGSGDQQCLPTLVLAAHFRGHGVAVHVGQADIDNGQVLRVSFGA